MRRTLADLMAYGRQYLRSPTATFFTLAFPILLVLVFGGVFGNPGDIELVLHVQDLDQTATSNGLVGAFNQTGVLRLVIVQEGDLASYIRNESVTAALQIPEGFEAKVVLALQGDLTAQPEVTLLGDMSSQTFQSVRGVVQAVVTSFNFGLQDASPVVGVGAENVTGESGSYLDFFLPGVIGITVLTSLFFTSNVAAEYRERHYFKLLATTPLRKAEFLLSRNILLIGFTFTSVLMMILVARVVFGSAFGLNLTSVALILAGTVLFTSIGLAVGSLMRDIEGANAIANVIYFPMMFLSGTFFPVESMPSFIQSISSALPLKYFNDGLRDTLIYGNQAGALTNLLIVAGLAVGVFVLAAWALRWKAE